jgi:two-component system, chemotaxis family, sensor kinase CheA
VGLDGVMASERSSIVEKWFGRAPDGMKLSDYIRGTDRWAADWLDLGLESLAESALPPELIICQLPTRMQNGQQTWSIAYRPIMGRGGDEKLERLLVVLSDITDELVREQMERDSREMVQLFQRVTADRGGAEQFFEEARALVERIAAADATPETEARLIHTLKGNCALFGVESMVQICHDIESELRSESRTTNQDEREQIVKRWRRITELTGAIFGERRSTIELEDVDLEELLKAIDAKLPAHELAAIANSWRHEPVRLRFTRLADKAIWLAKRLGKNSVTVHTDANGIHLDGRRWAPFWSAFVHAVNNAVDHGIENAETRGARGKTPTGNLWFSAGREGTELHISLRDDGQGIDWGRLAERAKQRGLHNPTTADLVEIMCMDGVSTRDNATATSGRGVGLAALKEVTLSLGGRMEVSSEPGKGTLLLFRFPDYGAGEAKARPSEPAGFPSQP